MRRHSCLLPGLAWSSEAAAHSPTSTPGNSAASHTRSDKAWDARTAAPRTESLEAFIPSGTAALQAVCARGSVLSTLGNKLSCPQKPVWVIFGAPRDTAALLLTQRDHLFPAVPKKAFPWLCLAAVTPPAQEGGTVPPHTGICVHKQLRERTGR